ncbi:hypothetical protein AMJ44_02190 [candidate division WOR-1 bacterium DG_54_3]|uniref:O-antigen ligase-related domain-containing protein n=1 Tax=candidate division WOR-1 bacterium DG_54_3 TaxID=1703775 RepID=A0A0S7Y6R7_UNCSA|nr:MAG: hypothetical protein AMJ44_02190 [candidate division WOR-1 bacterium DG_54_3]
MPLKVLLFLSAYFGCAVGALFRPVLGVCGYILTYALYNRHVWWGEVLAQYHIRYSFVMAVFILLGMVIQKRRTRWAVRPSNKLEVSIYLFTGIVVLSLIFGLSPDEESYFLLDKMLKVSFFIYMLTRVVDSLKNYDMVVYTLITTGIILAVQSYQAPPEMFFHGRLDALGGMDFVGSNELAIYLCVVLCFLGTFFLRAKNWITKFFLAPGAALVLNAIILTRARAVFVAILAAGVYSVIFIPKRFRKKLIVITILAIAMFLKLADPSFWDRMTTLKNYEQEKSASLRIQIWSASLKMLKEYPLGVGVGNFKRTIGNYDQRVVSRDAHNTFVRCYGELGMPGLILFAFILLLVFNHLRYAKSLSSDTHDTELFLRFKLDAFALSLAILVYLVGGNFHTHLYTEAMWWLLALPICLQNAVLKESNRKPIRIKGTSNVQ